MLSKIGKKWFYMKKKCTNTRLQIVKWGGLFNPNLSNKVTFFSSVKKNRIENYSILL